MTRVVTQKIQTRSASRSSSTTSPAPTASSAPTSSRRRPPDGYTMLTVIAGYAANVTLYQGKLPFDPVKSLVPVSLAGHRTAHPDREPQLPRQGRKGADRLRQSQPGQGQFGSSGIGAAAHLTTELLKQTAGIDMVHIPYKGTAPALTAEMANDIQILVDVPSTLMPHVRGGKIKALAMFSKERIEGAARSADDRRSRRAAARDPRPGCCSWRPEARRSRSSIASPRKPRRRSTSRRSRPASTTSASAVGNTPAQAQQFLDAEVAKWAKVINTAGVKAEQ